MATREFDIISRATVKMGAEAVASFDDETQEARLAEQLYEINVRAEICSGYFDFTRKTAELARYVDAPADPNYQYQYALPADLLQIEKAMDAAGATISYQVTERKLLSNAPRVRLTYFFRPDEATWSPAFQELISARLAWQFSEALSGESSVRDRFRNDYEWARREAKRVDAQSTPPSSSVFNNSNITYISVRGTY